MSRHFCTKMKGFTGYMANTTPTGTFRKWEQVKGLTTKV